MDNTKLKERPKITNAVVTEEKTVKLSWTKVNGAEKYGIKRAVSDKDEFEHIAWVKKCEFTDEEAPKDISCFYKIMAHKKLEGKKASTKISAVRAVVVSDIPAPEEVKAEKKGDKIKLTWNKVPGADGYIINKRNDFYSQMLPVARVSKCHFIDEKVVSGQPYHYSVQTYIKNEGSEKQGNFSQGVHCVSLDRGSIVQARTSFGKKVFIKLRLVAGADGYILQRSETQEGPFCDVAKTESGTDITFADNVPKRFKNYFYRAVAYKIVEKAVHKSEPTEKIQIKSR